MITLSAPHNHPIVIIIQISKSCSTSLRDVFNDTTRHEESADQISFNNCESMVYRALWTIFVDFGRHSILPGIHCLLTSKSEEIYTMLANIKEIVPQKSPSCVMGDWEQASRNAIKTTYPNITLYGCLFHHNQPCGEK